MKIYQIVEDYNNSFHAGSKATNDATIIFDQIGAVKLPITISSRNQGIVAKLVRQITFFKEWNRLYKKVENNSVVIIQSPFTIRQIGRYSVLKRLKQNKNVRFLSLVHDVEVLRFDTEKSRREFHEMLTFVDHFIVHNNNMKKWFMDQGIPDEKLTVLEIFDYLNKKSSNEAVNFSTTVTIAGNLSPEKSPYVYELGKIKNVKFELMGVNYDSEANFENVIYRGAFPPDEVANELTHGFGLVWDGPSVETCAGETGEYLRFNNPHKLSLYLSSSLPVIIWSEAAEAEFVKEHNVGIVVSSLYNLEGVLSTITVSEYNEMVKSTKKIKERLQAGYYLKTATEYALKLLNR